MKQKKKNKYFTFLCSCMPGAAEMYMGFMKNGLSLMALFFFSLMVPAVLRISDAFILVGVLIWFYGFFHARNLAACEDDIFMELEDVYIWEEFMDGKGVHIPGKTARKICAYALIIFGAISLWQNGAYALYSVIPWDRWNRYAPFIDNIPQIITALMIIVVGFKMIQGKKEELVAGSADNDYNQVITEERETSI